MKTKSIYDGKGYLTALWVPGWYELDQSIAVGQVAEFCFFTEPAEALLQRPSVGLEAGHADLVFFNSLMTSRNSRICKARVVAIEHPVLGPVRSIETRGLDYVFLKTDGQSVVVNAEEDPGAVQSGEAPPIDDWTATVTLADVFCVDDT